MKIIKLYFVLFLFLCSVMQSCLFQEKDIFDKSASERIDEAVDLLYEVLESSDGGWKLVYYTEPEEYGAYNILLKFKDGAVTMQGDTLFAEYSKKKDTSLYRINKSQGVVLDFDTYNKVLSFLADPSLFRGKGLGGDNEFIWQRTSENEDTIYFKSKKTYSKVQLTRFSEDWDGYFDNLNSVMTSFNSGVLERYFKLLNFEDNTTLILGGYNSVTRRIEQIYLDENEELGYVETGVAFSEEGISFYDPVNFSGKTIQNLTYDKTTETFFAESDGVNGVLAAGLPGFEIPGDLDKKLFGKDLYYEFTYLSQDLMDIYYSIIGKVSNSGIVLVPYRLYLNKWVYLFEVYYVDENGKEGFAAVKSFTVEKNINGRSDTFRFTEAPEVLALETGDYWELLEDDIKKFFNIVKQENIGYIAIPDMYFENIKFGAVESNTFIGITPW